MARLILPKDYVDTKYEPLMFLMGPIRGTYNWRDGAIKKISEIDSEMNIATPDIMINPRYSKDVVCGEKNKFQRQTHWERHYLGSASKNGSIMVWLARQTQPMYIDEKSGFQAPYARDTRGELGGWGWGPLYYDKNFPIVVGAEEEFPGLEVIKANFLAVKPGMIFYDTLEKTCVAAVEVAKFNHDGQYHPRNFQ